MEDNIKQSIEELKEIVLLLLRDASDLDSSIQYLVSNEQTDKTYLNMLIKTVANNRTNFKKYSVGNVDSKEECIWQQIIDMTKEEM